MRLARHLRGLHLVYSPPLPPTVTFPMAASHNTTSEVVRLARDKVEQSEVFQVLSTILNATDYINSIRQLPEQDLRMWVDRLDKVHWL